MKRVALAILVIALSVYIVSAQSVTERFATALNNQDILYLQENLPYYKDSLPQHISLMAEALCYSQTNRYHKSNKAIEELLNNHAEVIGSDVVGSFYSLLISNLYMSGNTAAAAELIKGNEQSREAYNYFKALSRKRPLQVLRPKRDVVIPFTRSQLSSGSHIHIPVKIGGKSESFIFDTGANKYNVITESCAARYNFTPLFDSLSTTGVGGSGTSRVVTIKKIKIGKIVVKNPAFIVIADDTMPADSLGGFKLEFVLGTDVMEALGRVSFDMEQSTMTIPAVQSATNGQATPMTHADCYYIYPTINGHRLKMQFDTGAVSSSMYSRYLAEFGEKTTLIGEEQSGRARGFGGTTHYKAQKAEKIEFEIGGNICPMQDVEIITTENALPYQHDEYGVLGADIALRYSRFTIDFMQICVLTE
ncbi:MAG: aspartyl protease family protein [Alistipes sp.]|nr:aspartyl protease family protein [Alistipes sp.]